LDTIDFAPPATTARPLRNDWTQAEVEQLFELPFAELLFRAHSVHRANFDPNEVQLSTLISIKTGGCPEDCGYCAQSARYETGVAATKLLSTEDVIEDAKRAQAAGATRYCMGAAWRNPKDAQLAQVCEMIAGVKQLGMETCATLGMVTSSQCGQLKDAGLDYYNHNIDTSEAYYDSIITTRTYSDRLDTLANVRESGMNVCCGGILGMGESRQDRASMIATLASLPKHPESVPINMLIPIEGTPLSSARHVDPIEFVRTIAAARITMPASMVRLSAGRQDMSDEMHALCFFAGANSIFVGSRLLTADNSTPSRDEALFANLKISPMPLPQGG